MINEKTQIALLHHNDRDGIVAAHVVIHMLQCMSVDITVISTDYATPFHEKIEGEYDKYILVDLSIANDINAEFIHSLCLRGADILWIDHHSSSIRFMKKNPQYELDKIKGLRIIGLSGAALTWLWYYTNTNSLLELSNTDYEYDKEEAVELLTRKHCPYYIIMTHRYDTHDIDDDVLNFSYGYNPIDPSDVSNDFYKCISGIDCINRKCKCVVLDPYIKNGIEIRKYQNSKDDNTANEIGFEITIEVYEDYKFKDTYTGFAMDRVFGNSMAFGDRMKKYDICIPFYYNGKNFTYSMYTVRDDIDCSVLCEALGGGGHPKAAGFTTDEFIFGGGKREIVVSL